MKTSSFSVGAVVGSVATLVVVGGVWALAGGPAAPAAPAPPRSAAGHADHSAHAAPADPAARAALKGKVLESIQVPGYTYLRLDDELGEVWAAVATVEVATGSVVSVHKPFPMDNFHSKSLQRTFERIYFGSLQQ
jgi:transcription antitermination factor NusG